MAWKEDKLAKMLLVTAAALAVALSIAIYRYSHVIWISLTLAPLLAILLVLLPFWLFVNCEYLGRRIMAWINRTRN